MRYLYDFCKHYACRECAKLNYSCQQKSGMDEIRLKMERIAERLDYQRWRNDFDSIADVYYIPKPHYMRWDKYEKLMQEFRALQKEYECNLEDALIKHTRHYADKGLKCLAVGLVMGQIGLEMM